MTQLRPGEIATLQHDITDHHDQLTALHASAPGQAVVRLVPAKLTQAESLMLSVVGITPGESKAVGVVRERAAGFPAWPIITDPDNAHHALNLVGELEWARRHVHKAHVIKQRIDEVTAHLTAAAPHFAPTLLEEVGRIFIGIGEVARAKQFFSKARDVERSHALDLDPERHAAAFAEFAAAGAINDKDLSREASAVLTRLDPEAAFDYFLGLLTAMGRAGVPLYANAGRDLRRIGKAADYNDERIDAALFGTLLELPGMGVGGAAFLRQESQALRRYLEPQPELLERLTRRPNECGFELRQLRREWAEEPVEETVPVAVPATVTPEPIDIEKGARRFLEILLGNKQTTVTTRSLLKLIASFNADPNTTVYEVQDPRLFTVLKYVGNERALLAIVASPLLPGLFADRMEYLGMLGYLRELVDSGILCGPWHLGVIELGDEAVVRDTVLPQGTVMDDCFILAVHLEWRDGVRIVSRYVWVPDQRGTLGGYSIVRDQQSPMIAEDFLRCLDILEQHAGTSDGFTPESVAAASAGTGLSTQAITYLFGGGYNHKRGYQRSFLTNDERTHYGFSAAQATGARSCISAIPNKRHLLAAGINPDNITTYVKGTLDADAITNYWLSTYGEPAVPISSETYAELETLFRENEIAYATLPTIATTAELLPWSGGDILTILLRAAEQLTVENPARHLIAQKLEQLRTDTANCMDDPEFADALGGIELGGDYKQSGLDRFVGDIVVIRVLLDGYVDALIADLRAQHATYGYGADPNVSAPDIVADVARELSLSENAARYYLQLLALAHPTDKNIRLWNSWKKKDITAAASELLANNLIIEAKRTRAGRSYFLPGAWLEGVSGSAPIEQWKTPYYLYWKDTKARPVIAGSPMIMPYRQLFTDAWQRYRSGDTPGYADLDTAQYRKPSRRR